MPKVQVEDGSSLSEVLMDGAWKVVTSGVIVAVLVFFLLSIRDQLSQDHAPASLDRAAQEQRRRRRVVVILGR